MFPRHEYDQLLSGSAVVDCRARTLVELAGQDRARFLHGFCTNDIKRLSPGEGCEAFITSVQGKVLGYTAIFAQEDSLVLDTVPGQAEKLLAHFDRYLIREDVRLIDRGNVNSQWLLGGQRAPLMLNKLGIREVPQSPYASAAGRIGNCHVWLRRVPWFLADAFLIEGAAENLDAIYQALTDAGGVPASPAAARAARIEAGTPEYGQDISEKNLPQEVGRDRQAISFTKGCYLGQETVARIDALGHVNRLLVGVRFEGPSVPPAASALFAGESEVGQVTSASFSPRFGVPLALAYVRREQTAPGTRLHSGEGAAEVVTLPAEPAN